ncbi:glycosyltransferase [Gordonia iterans]
MTDETTAPTISVLVPAFNPGDYFPPAIESALSQLGRHDEIVIQDAGSNDGTGEVIAGLEADPRVRAVIEPDEGQSDALNRALARAQGEWIIWLNADDILVDGALEALREAIGRDPALEVVTGDHQLLRADGEVIDEYRGRPITTDVLLRRSTCASFSGSVAVRTDLLRKLGGFDESLNCAMDYELQYRIAASDPVQQAVDAPIGALRFHDASKSANLWKGFLAETLRLRARYATTWRQRGLAMIGVAEQLASFAVFRIRLSPVYRKLRNGRS